MTKHSAHRELKHGYPFSIVALLLVVIVVSAVGVFVIFRSHAATVSPGIASGLGFEPGQTAGETQIQTLNGLEALAGHPAKYVMQNAGQNSVDDFEGSVWGEVTASASQGGYLYQTLSNRLNFVLSVPLTIGYDNAPSPNPAYNAAAMQQTLSGKYDSSYSYIAGLVRDAGFTQPVFRLGWEFDGDWYPWSASGGNEQLYIQVFRHVHDVMKAAVPGAKFDWTGDPGFFNSEESAYPGDAYVDDVGLDAYDGAQGSDGNTNLQVAEDFAKAHGKQVSYGEWATTSDNVSYIDHMYNWFNSLPASGAGSLGYESYFNQDNGNGNFTIYPSSHQPNASAEYHRLFSQAGSSNPAPTTTSLAPTSGPTAGGTVVNLTGSNYTSGATVSFGATASSSVSVKSATQITAATPAHTAGAVNVVVTNPDGQSATDAGAYTYTGTTSQAPTLTSISPTSGTTTGGTTVTLTGANFVSGASVSIGGIGATSVSFKSATSITAIAPPHSAGAADVVVTNPSGQSVTLTNGFTYTTVQGLPDLIVTSVSTTPASPVSGDQVTFKATVKNQGSAATPAGVIIGVAFSIGGNVVNWSDSDTTSLAAGASVTLTANGGPDGPAPGTPTWTATPGNQTLEADVDDVNRIPETNDSNNTLSTSFTVSNQATNPADFNNDGNVNITDLSILAAHYNLTGQTKATGDANGDNIVNILDLSILASEWGT